MKVSDDWIVQLHIKEMLPKNKHLPTDFYWEQGKMIMTERYHARRGSCCGNKCRHCPYAPAAIKGNTTLKS